MNQLPIQMFDTPRARRRDPQTSHEAAAVVAPAARGLEQIVYDCLVANGPLTTHEIAELTGLTVVTVSPRIKPMRDQGRVMASGDRRDGRNVWKAV